MSQLASYSPVSSDLRTEDDYALVNRLLRSPRYKIPEYLRDKVVNQIEQTLDNDENEDALKLKAIQVLSQLDKHNLDIVKLTMPQKTEALKPSDCNDEELKELVLKILKTQPHILDPISLEAVTDG